MTLWKAIASRLAADTGRKHVYMHEVFDAVMYWVNKDPSLTPEQKASAPKAVFNMLQWKLNGDN